MRRLLKDETDNSYQKVISKSNNCLLQKACEKVKHELQIRVTSTNPRVTSSNPRVRTLKARAARLKAPVRRLKARVGRDLKHELGDQKHESKQ